MTQERLLVRVGDAVTPASFATLEKKTYGVVSVNAPEAKRQGFVEQLASVDPTRVVYVDEAGMDNRDDYPYGAHSAGSALSGTQEWTKTFCGST